LLHAVCLFLALQRASRQAPPPRPLALVLFDLVGASLRLSVLRALLPLQRIDANSYYSHYNRCASRKGRCGLFSS
jgi:hypothetical protein